MGLSFAKGLVALLLVLAASHSAFAESQVDKNIQFSIPRAPLTPFQKARLPADSLNPAGRTLTARYRAPAGDGPFPAAVLVHTCHDAKLFHPWLDLMQSWGLATLSFTRCQPPDFKPVDNKVPSLDWKEGALAAYGALKFLRDQPNVKSDSIVLLAWSRLGMIPLSVFNPEGAAQFFEERFAAGVAFYPFCSFARGPHERPLLVLSAGKDDWVDSGVCARMARLTADDPVPVEFKLLPDAHHGFDIAEFGHARFVGQGINPDGFAAGGGTLGYSKSAHQTAIKSVQEFLARQLNLPLTN